MSAKGCGRMARLKGLTIFEVLVLRCQTSEIFNPCSSIFNPRQFMGQRSGGRVARTFQSEGEDEEFSGIVCNVETSGGGWFRKGWAGWSIRFPSAQHQLPSKP